MDITAAAAPFAPIGRMVDSAWRGLLRAMAVSAERRQLAELDDAALKDLGLSRAQASFEASRPAWDFGTADAVPVRCAPLINACRVAAE